MDCLSNPNKATGQIIRVVTGNTDGRPSALPHPTLKKIQCFLTFVDLRVMICLTISYHYEAGVKIGVATSDVLLYGLGCI
jgi:hypothetical protein